MTKQPKADEIYILAYSFWQERGCPEGSPEIDWYRAERELQGEQGETSGNRLDANELAQKLAVEPASIHHEVAPLKRRSIT